MHHKHQLLLGQRMGLKSGLWLIYEKSPLFGLMNARLRVIILDLQEFIQAINYLFYLRHCIPIIIIGMESPFYCKVVCNVFWAGKFERSLSNVEVNCENLWSELVVHRNNNFKHLNSKFWSWNEISMKWYVSRNYVKYILANQFWKQYHNQRAFSLKFTPRDPPRDLAYQIIK